VVAAAGNEGRTAIAYPARAPDVVAVGATTEHGCLADYSNDGNGLTLVAPGGGADAALPGDPNCHPEQPPGRSVYQETFTGSSVRRFGLPSGYEGTSMASPHVAATAALIIATVGDHGVDFLLTVTAATPRPVQLRFAECPSAEELRRDLNARLPPEAYFADVHGSAPYKRHITQYLAEEIRRELA